MLWIESDNSWDEWMDLPIILNIEQNLVSISWRKFDDLAISREKILPDFVKDSKIKWDTEGHEILDKIIGKKIYNVRLEKNTMTFESKEIEIWTDLYIDFENKLSICIFNDLDQNGISLMY